MAPSQDPTYPLFPVLSFLGFVLSLVPLPWHIQAWNSGTVAFMVWTGLTCLNGFVNSLVWKGNLNNPAPIWCDISSKWIIGASIGIPASTLCISRRLYNLTAIKTVSITRKDKRRMIFTDLCIAVGIPFIIMILHVIVQGHRFDIFEDIGCYPVVYNTLPAYFLYTAWPVVLGVISFGYSALTLRSFWLRRLQFSQLVNSNNSSLSMSRYLRLMALSIMDIMCTIPLGIFTIYIGTKGVNLAPWISWADTHFDFARVSLVPALFWRSDKHFQTAVELTRWLPVVCSFLFFALFGFASEAQKHYKIGFWAVAKLFGFKPVQKQTSIAGWNKPPKLAGSGPSVGSLPIYVPRTPSSPSQKKAPSTFVSTSYAESEDVELDTYTNVDLEKSGGLSPTSTATFSVPPSYNRPHPVHVPSSVSTMEPDFPDTPISPSSSHLTVVDDSLVHSKANASTSSLRSLASQDRVYVTSEIPPVRTPSPAPFANVIPPYHRPFTPPNAHPVAEPHPSTVQSFADAIQVTVHSESRGAI